MPELSLILDSDLAAQSATDFRERILLILAGVFLLVAQSELILVKQSGWLEYWHWAVWVGCVLAGHLILNRRLPRRDPLIFPVVMLLAGWGVILISRLAPDFSTRQTVWLAISTTAMLAVVLLPGHLRWLSRYRYLWLLLGLGLLLVTIVLGINPTYPRGPRLWIGIANFVYFQPSEILKVLLIVFLASYLADNQVLIDLNPLYLRRIRLPSLRFLAPLILMWGISGLLLVWQKDLGAATLFFVVFLAMLYLATNQGGYVLVGGLLLLAVGAVAYFNIDLVRERLNVWIDPWSVYNSDGFQIVQSLLALAAGGVFGQGIAQGSPTYIPVVHSDFVFAAIGEEWGLLGTLAVTGLLTLLTLRGLRLAVRTQARPFRAFLAAGISIALAVQSLLIMGGVVKLIPLTGITLPLISYGGSSLLANFLMIGLLLVLSGET